MSASLTPEQFNAAVRATQATARAVSSRFLRRLIRAYERLPSTQLRVPHAHVYWLDRGALLALAPPGELDVADLPERVLLVARPPDHVLARQSAAQTLTHLWRQLFHGLIDQAWERRLGRLLDPTGQAPLSDSELADRVDRLGVEAVQEAYGVLRAEHYLPATADERRALRELVAVYAELRYFAPHQLASFFPALPVPRVVDALFNADVPLEPLFTAARPAGAPDPEFRVDASDQTFDEPEEAPSDEQPPTGPLTAWIAQADAAYEKGNVVRALVRRMQAAQLDRANAETHRAAAESAFTQLVERLAVALHWAPEVAEEWKSTLRPLLEPAGGGHWAPAARLLYDLQKVCLDTERALYAVELVEWLRSFGRRPVQRLLTRPREVLVLRHLRSAYRRLTRVKLADEARQRLVIQLRLELHHAGERLRADLRPGLETTLDAVGLTAANLPERIGREKLIAELLDRVGERGFLNFGDLRDAVARNPIKLPDVSGPVELLRGDALLQADRRLAEVWDGVYHPAEVYLRGLQTFSALSFGTRVGRFLTLYLALPFGGGYIALEGLSHLLHLFVGLFAFVARWFRPPHVEVVVHPTIGAELVSPDLSGEMPTPHSPLPTIDSPLLTPHSALDPHSSLPTSHSPLSVELPHFHEHLSLVTPASIIGVGIFALLLIHWPAFRQGLANLVWRGLQFVGSGLSALWNVTRWPGVAWALDTAPARFAWYYLTTPVLVASVAGATVYALTANSTPALYAAGGVFAVVLVLSNTWLGRDLEKFSYESVAYAWEQFWQGVLLSVGRALINLFKWLMDGLEKLLYTVDEWLRFRQGESALAYAGKLVFGLVWFVITYVVRFAVNLLIEPQINPIKHFPVVTVSHKVLLPFVGNFASLLRIDYATAFTIVAAIPGVFGFLAWELMSNWRLYRANRSRRLTAQIVGHHGESVAGLLRPGFHSGTVPKLFAQLRQAEQQALVTGSRRLVRKRRLELEHVEEAVAHLIERELLWFLHASRRWHHQPIELGHITLDTTRIRMELTGPADSEPLWLAFEEQAGWLVARIEQPGWLPRLNEPQRAALADALLGLYQRAGVDVVSETVLHQAGPWAQSARITANGLTVRGTVAGTTVRVRYDLAEQPARPEVLSGPPEGSYGTLNRVILSQSELGWNDWVNAWEADATGKEPAALVDAKRLGIG
jgi:hypothetical protein